MKAITWILAVVGVLGVAGTIAAIVLIPAVALPILQRLVAGLLSCRPCLYAIAIGLACMGCWWLGHHQAVLDCRAGELAAKLAAQQADLDNARKSAADEAARATTIEASANDQRKKDAFYIATLEARPACALDDLDLGRLPNRQPWARRAKPAAGAR